jgi:phosphocarrier protein
LKKTTKVLLRNTLGLHIRPATEIVKLLQDVKSHVTFTHRQQSVNAKSLINLLMLAARQNARITIDVEGEDAQQTLEKLVCAFEDRFGE